MSCKVLVIHGPNLNLLGTREPATYGGTTLAEIDSRLAEVASEIGVEVVCKQTNLEGEFVELIHGARGVVAGLLVNPGGYSHTSVAIRDAIVAVGLPTVEVHLSNVAAREEFRSRALTGAVALGVVSGFKADSYEWGLRALVKVIHGQ